MLQTTTRRNKVISTNKRRSCPSDGGNDKWYLFGRAKDFAPETIATLIVVLIMMLAGYAQWARTSTGVKSLFSGVAVDTWGNIYGVGAIRGPTTGFGKGVGTLSTAPGGDGVALVKYSTSGVAKWARTLTAGVGGAIYSGVAVDSWGNIYAVRQITGTRPSASVAS